MSFEIPHRATVGLVGLNGAGKSTLVKLLCRMYEPQHGQILWDGEDIATLDPAAVRARIGAVFQDFMTYDLTARENIGLGEPSRMDNVAAIRRAARIAGVHDDIVALPRGYDTMLSRVHFPDDGDDRDLALLSGGQRQRLALARAFLRDAELLILDEPSSGLDAAAEAAVHERLRALRSGRTSLLISHRLGTLRDADRLVVIESGVVAEAGTHDELVAAGGTYARLFALQARGYQAAGSAGLTKPRDDPANHPGQRDRPVVTRVIAFRVVPHHENVAGWNPAAPRRRVFGKRHRPLHHQRQCGFHDTRSGVAQGRRG